MKTKDLIMQISYPTLLNSTSFLLLTSPPKADTLDHITSSYKDTISDLNKGEASTEHGDRVSDPHLKLSQHCAELVRAQQLTSSYWHLAAA